MRRADGSIPQLGDQDFVPQPQRPFSDQKAYAMPRSLIESDPNYALDQTPDLYGSFQGQSVKPTGDDELTFLNKSLPPESGQQAGETVDPVNLKKLSDNVTGFKGLAKWLTPSEINSLSTVTARNFVKLFTSEAPKLVNDFAAAAYAGRSKRGWYEQSAKAIQSIFGAEDAPRFASLLAGLSPQTSVESNLTNTLNVWAGWIEADRPTDE